jgi:cysteinyl-tRNA synthetase
MVGWTLAQVAAFPQLGVLTCNLRRKLRRFVAVAALQQRAIELSRAASTGLGAPGMAVFMRSLGARMREVRIQDTLSGTVRTLEPRDPPKVGIYACGPTVYGRVHVGNARPYVLFSLLKRFLQHEGYDATFVANVTDVNDKIYDAARERGMPSEQLAREMTDAYVADTNALGLERPDHEPKASETIAGIIELIQALIDSGHAYEARGDVYFRVASFEGYGKLSNRPLDEMQQGEGDDSADVKEAPQDFALWKARKEGEDTWWESPWGEGRPGWHIECSAMAEQILGVDFEIHGGGSDLIFPHHENEIAQTEAARGLPLARLWMHNGMVEMGDEKMAKSLGNIRLLHGAIEQFGRAAFLMWIVGAHYRKPVAYTEETLEDAGRAVDRVRELIRRLDPQAPAADELDAFVERFFDHLADDFNTAAARAELFAWVAEANRRADAGERLGPGRLGEMLHAFGLEGLLDDGEEQAPAEIERLAAEREDARKARDFERADRLRDELAASGWEIRDTAEGPRLVRT